MSLFSKATVICCVLLLFMSPSTSFGDKAAAMTDAVADPSSSAAEPVDNSLLKKDNKDSVAASSLFVWREPEEGRRHYAQLLHEDERKESDGLRPVLSWETGEGKSYLIPALEIPGFIILLNAFDRVVLNDSVKNGRKVYATNPSTFWDQLTRQDWTFDQDSFKVNQFGHPYEGATMYGLARSSGLNFWQSLVYSNVGSFLWEMGGETSRPSVNDQITTGNAGSLLGEALFRIAELVIEDGGSNPPFGHKLAAAVISPPTAFNRFAFGERFKEVYPSNKPARFWRATIGASVDTHASNLSRPVEEASKDGDIVLDFNMTYGLPGKPGYTYHRPFDYFDFEVSTRARTHNLVEVLTIRGLLKGTEYGVGDDYRGIWGLYGSYDYISPYLFRVSSTALSLGTTGQYWAAPGVAVQGMLLGGVGFGATGIDSDVKEERGYHYGATPQALLALSVLFGKYSLLDLTGRVYYMTSAGPDESPGDETVFRGHAGFTVRVYGQHAVGLHYSESIRATDYGNIPSKYRAEGTLSLVYSYINDINFGAVEWREGH